MAKETPATAPGLGAILRWPLSIEAVYLAAPVVALMVAALLNTIKPYDYFWALVQGRLIAQTGANTAHNLFLYTLPADAPYFNQPWLAQLILHGLATHWGHAANVVLLAVALAVAMIAVLDTGLRIGISARWLAVAAMLSTPFLAIGAGVRTQLFAFPCFALMLRTLLVPGWHGRRLLWLAAIAAAHTNLHGSFVLLPVLAVVTMFGRRDLSPRVRLTVVLVVAGAVCLHPSGPRALAYALAQPRAMGVAGGSAIEEWRSLSPTTPLGIGFLAGLAALAVVVLRARRRLHLTGVVLVAVLSLAALFTTRFIPFVALLAPLALPGEQPRSPDPFPRALSWVNLSLVSLLALLVLAALPFGPLSRALRSRGPEPSLGADVPLRLAQKLAALRPGRIFHTQAVGGLLEWTLCSQGPEPVAFVDQRFELIPPHVWREYLEACAARPGFERILNQYGVVAVLAESPEAKPLLEALANDPAWRLDDREGEFRLYLRRRKILP
jgi:hypothetical protein